MSKLPNERINRLDDLFFFFAKILLQIVKDDDLGCPFFNSTSGNRISMKEVKPNKC